MFCLFWGRSLGGEGLELGSGVQISKLALGLGLGLRALLGPILKLERPTPAARTLLLSRDLGMIEVGWISEAVALAAEDAFTLNPSGGGGYVGGCCVFHEFSFVAQVARLAPDVQLIEMPVK